MHQEALSEPWRFIRIPPYELARINGIALVLLVPLWGITFTAVVTLCKWVIIGRYKAKEYASYGKRSSFESCFEMIILQGSIGCDGGSSTD